VVGYTGIMKKNIFKKEQPLIKFVSVIEGLEQIEDCVPKPSKKYIPDWFKTFPISKDIKDKTVRDCPSFPDYFSQGYVIPMWQDSLLKYNKQNDRWDIQGPEITKWSIHGNHQFLHNADASFQGIKSNFIFKALCPWRIITPPGYSVLQLPMFYHFNQNWSVLPGVIDTDIWHECNQQVSYHGNGEEIFIPRGAPLAMYIPFKRENYNLKTSSATDEEKKKFRVLELILGGGILSGGTYRKLQKKQNKKNNN